MELFNIITTMKLTATRIIGMIIMGMGLAMFCTWLFMATKELEVIGLKDWYVWGCISVGAILVIIPEEKAIKYILQVPKIFIAWLRKISGTK